MWRTGPRREAIGDWLRSRQPRGAVVPFEAPALQMARVCEDERDGLIAILHDFANNGTAYVVSWTNLPLLVSMTDQDKALHHAVAEAKATTPAAVRAAVSVLALAGGFGPEAKAREAARSLTDRSQLADVELVLMLHLLSSTGADLAELVADPGSWQTSGGKRAVTAAAAAVGIGRREIYQRISQLAQLLGPVGLVTANGPIQLGWLRVLHGEVAEFSANCGSPATTASADIAADLAAVAVFASRTAQLSEAVLGVIDYAILDIRPTIHGWEAESQRLRQIIDRLSLLLDEWPAMMQSVRGALRGTPSQVAVQLHALRAMLRRTPAPPPVASRSRRQGEADGTTISNALATRLATIWSVAGRGPRDRTAK
jgi:hypothetical protein